jgi:hypothetical protein
MIFTRKQGFALEHFGKDAACTPDVYLDVVFLPSEHDFWSSIVSCRDIASHLRILNTSQAKVAYLEITILVDEDIAWFQVPVHDSSGVDIFKTTLSSVSS